MKQRRLTHVQIRMTSAWGYSEQPISEVRLPPQLAFRKSHSSETPWQRSGGASLPVELCTAVGELHSSVSSRSSISAVLTSIGRFTTFSLVGCKKHEVEETAVGLACSKRSERQPSETEKGRKSAKKKTENIIPPCAPVIIFFSETLYWNTRCSNLVCRLCRRHGAIK